jgi:pimeloyl-ACP methyl ester carboxylesterase
MSSDPQIGPPSIAVPGSAFAYGTVQAGGYTLDYASAGPENPEAVIVSLPGSAGLEMSTAKDRLAARYRVVEINPPGWGARDDVDTRMHQSQLGPVLTEAIEQLVDGPFFLIGTSMGGSNALYVAAALPDRVRGIVLEGGMAPSRPEDLRMPPPPEPGSDAGPEASYPAPVTDPRKPWATPEYVTGQMAVRMRMFGWIEPDMQASEAIAAVRERHIPVLALLGDDDEIIAPTQELRFRDELPHADFRLVPTGAHDLQNTVPGAFVDLVEGFIASAASS